MSKSCKVISIVTVLYLASGLINMILNPGVLAVAQLVYVACFLVGVLAAVTAFTGPARGYHAAAALYHSGLPAHREPLRRALEFLVWHMSLKDDETICRPFYHGHVPVKELLMLSEMRVGLSERAVRVMLDYLSGMFDPGKGHFRYRPAAGRRRRGDPTARALKYRLHHLMEDDWLTYYGLRILSNLR